MIPGEICYKVCRLATIDLCFADFRKNGFTCYPLLSVAFIFVISLILFRHLGGATLF